MHHSNSIISISFRLSRARAWEAFLFAAPTPFFRHPFFRARTPHQRVSSRKRRTISTCLTSPFPPPRTNLNHHGNTYLGPMARAQWDLDAVVELGPHFNGAANSEASCHLRGKSRMPFWLCLLACLFVYHFLSLWFWDIESLNCDSLDFVWWRNLVVLSGAESLNSLTATPHPLQFENCHQILSPEATNPLF